MALADVRGGGRQGDRPAQPPRLVELPLLPGLRPRVDVPELRGRAGAAPGPGLPRLPPLRAPRAGAEPLRGVRLGRRRPPRRRAPRASSTSCARRSGQSSRCSGSTPTPPRARTAWPGPLAEFEAAPSGVLLGTQMVAKGHDFADVTLGVVLDADQTLRFPDFRAEERTFALVTQLAGRVGRRGWDAGPRRPASWCRRWPRRRARSRSRRATTPTASSRGAQAARGAGLPAVWLADPDRVLGERGRRGAHAVATRLHGLIAPAGGTVLGPAPLFRLRGRSRSQLVIKCRDRLATVRAVGAAVDACAADAVTPRGQRERRRRPAVTLRLGVR